MNFLDYVRSLGLDPLALTAEQSDALEAAWRAHSVKEKPKVSGGGVGPDGKPTETLDDLVAAAQAEADRKAGVTALIKTYLGKAPDRIKELDAVGRMALDGGWTVKDTEYHLLKQCYASGPMAYVPSQSGRPDVSQQVLEAAVCRAAGLARESVERAFSDQILSAADKHFKGGCGLQRLLTYVAAANGHRDAHHSDLRGLLKAAFPDDNGPMASGVFGPSTYSVGSLLSNVANKFILDSYNAVESTWKMISATRPVNDFRQIASYALTGDLTYKKIGPGGEIKHGTLGDEEYTNRAEMYGLMLGIDYQHLRNDDLGAFSQLSRRLGRGGALTLNLAFWTEFLAGQGTFWSAANGNYYAHTDYAFTLAGLANAHIAWSLRTDPDGQPMADEARFLLVPAALDVLSRQYMSSTAIGSTTNQGDENVLAGEWDPVSSRYLSNANIANYSASNYFLVADPAETPVIEVVFLDGQEMPKVESAEADFNRLGIMLRGTHAFGVAKQNPRGAIKFKQTA